MRQILKPLDHEIDKTKPFGKHCQVSWLPCAQQSAHDSPQVVSHRRGRISFLDLFESAKSSATGPTGVAQVGERAFNPFAAQSLQTPAPHAGRVPPVTATSCLFSRAGAS